MRRFLKFLVGQTIVRLVNYVKVESADKGRSVLTELNRRAFVESADYAAQHMSGAMAFPRREPLWDFALSRMTVSGLVVEFGVYKGESINYVAQRLLHRAGGDALVYGFDSFFGLAEDWRGTGDLKGTGTLGGKAPRVASNVRLIHGWFDATLPAFLRSHPEPFVYVHIDCDTYEATWLVLSLIAERLVPGTIIVFDEYFGYRGWRQGEQKAWAELVASRRIAYDYIGFSTEQVAVVIK